MFWRIDWAEKKWFYSIRLFGDEKVILLFMFKTTTNFILKFNNQDKLFYN